MHCKKQEDSKDRPGRVTKCGRWGSNNPNWQGLGQALEANLQQGKNQHFDYHSMDCAEKNKITGSNYF